MLHQSAWDHGLICSRRSLAGAAGTPHMGRIGNLVDQCRTATHTGAQDASRHEVTFESCEVTDPSTGESSNATCVEK